MKSTVPATLVLRPSVPNRVIARIPDSPAVRRCQLSTLPAPSEVTRPLPVTTEIGRPALSRMLPMCSPASLLLGATEQGSTSDAQSRPHPAVPPTATRSRVERQGRRPIRGAHPASATTPRRRRGGGHEERPTDCRFRDTRIKESCNVRYGTKTILLRRLSPLRERTIRPAFRP